MRYRQLTDRPVADATFDCVHLNGKIYEVGGQQLATRIYDISAGTWASGAAVPSDWVDRREVRCATDGTYIYAAGGAEGTGGGLATSRVDRYDIGGDSWSSMTDLPADRCAGIFVAWGGSLWYAGGGDEAGASSGVTDVYEYDIAGDSWAKVGDLSVGNHQPYGGVTSGGVLIVAGGKNAGLAVADTHSYDLSDDSTADLSDMPDAVFLGAAEMSYDELWCFGGKTATGSSNRTNYVQRYCVASGNWTARGHLFTANDQFNAGACAADGRDIWLGIGRIGTSASNNSDEWWHYIGGPRLSGSIGGSD